MLKDLKAFLLRGNIVDLAVAVVIGAAFGAIVTSFVNDIITPLILNPALKAAEKAQNLGKKEEAVEEETPAPTQEELLTEIRDLLANK